MPYQQIRSYLQSPRQIIIDPLRKDCNPPEDPNWPSPRTRYEVEQLMGQLPHWAQVVCALTAAEMVLPIWEEWARQNMITTYIREAPSQAIDITQRWLDEEVSASEMNAAAHAAAGSAVDTANNTAGSAANTAGDAAYAAVGAAAAAGAGAGGNGATIYAAYSVYNASAAHASYNTGTLTDSFRNWWRLCRCRLAFILEARTL